MNARTELAPEGWGLGDVMRPAARGRGRGLLPTVTSWGSGRGRLGRLAVGARAPSRGWRGGVSRPRGSGARAGAALHPPRAGSGLCPGLGGADGRRAAWRCLRQRRGLWKPGSPSWG